MIIFVRNLFKNVDKRKKNNITRINTKIYTRFNDPIISVRYNFIVYQKLLMETIFQHVTNRTGKLYVLPHYIRIYEPINTNDLLKIFWERHRIQNTSSYTKTV